MQRWSIQKSFFVLLGSFLATTALCVGGYCLYSKWKKKRFTDERYKITALIQTGLEKEVLRTVYLAELLGLSVDQPKNIYAMDLKQAETAILTSPIISSAKVQRILPNTLYIDYEVRRPIAWISDYQNLAMDREGYLFPVTPFFSPKEMPEIYLGLPSFGAAADSFGRKGGMWRTSLKNRYIDLAFDVLQTFEDSYWKKQLRIKRIDVSNAFAPSLGRREIVLFTEEEIALRKGEKELVFVFPKILRLATKDYMQQLQNFFTLRKTMVDDYRKQLANLDHGELFAPRIVDLRIQQLAFIENRS